MERTRLNITGRRKTIIEYVKSLKSHVWFEHISLSGLLLYVWQLVWTAGSMRTRHSHCKVLLSGLADLCNMQERIFETTEKKLLHLKMHVLNCRQAGVSIKDQLKVAESNSYSAKQMQRDF